MICEKKNTHKYSTILPPPVARHTGKHTLRDIYATYCRKIFVIAEICVNLQAIAKSTLPTW